MLHYDTLFFLVGAGFISAFIDSVVGGGGLISLPALMLTGLPPLTVLGTNKMASMLGSFTSMVSFLRSGHINRRLIAFLFPLSFAGSALGVETVKLVPAYFLKPMVIVLLAVIAIYTLFKKDFGQASTFTGLTHVKGIACAGAAAGLGFYDGFFGPGTGSFLLFSFLMLGFDFVMAAGNSRALNFASNLSAVLFFGLSGLINFSYALPMGAAMIAGAWCGSLLAIRKGTAYVRPLFLLITSILIGRQLWDIIS